MLDLPEILYHLKEATYNPLLFVDVYFEPLKRKHSKYTDERISNVFV